MTLLHHNIPYQATISENDQPSQILMLIFPLIVEYILKKKMKAYIVILTVSMFSH